MARNRKPGFYWVKSCPGADWNVAQWNGTSWMELMYSLPSAAKDSSFYKIGRRIPTPRY